MRTKYYTRLHAEILRQGWTFAELSRVTGIHQQTIADYCHDRPRSGGSTKVFHRIPNRRHTTVLARALEMHPDLIRDRGQYILEAVASTVVSTA